MGIDPADFTWRDLALCDGMDPNLFFDAYENDIETAKQVDAACLHCPVMAQCAKAGQDGQYGVWGAIYWDGYGKPDINKNAHKTEEIYGKIKGRLS